MVRPSASGVVELNGETVRLWSYVELSGETVRLWSYVELSGETVRLWSCRAKW